MARFLLALATAALLSVAGAGAASAGTTGGDPGDRSHNDNIVSDVLNGKILNLKKNDILNRNDILNDSLNKNDILNNVLSGILNNNNINVSDVVHLGGSHHWQHQGW